MNNIQNELMHYGVLGQKWGIRKTNYKNNNSNEQSKLKRKKIMIGVGAGLTLATAGYIYLKNKEKIDKYVNNFLVQTGHKSIIGLSAKQLKKMSPEDQEKTINEALKIQEKAFTKMFEDLNQQYKDIDPYYIAHPERKPI